MFNYRKFIELLPSLEGQLLIIFLEKFLPRMAVLVACTITSAILISALLLGGLNMLFHALVEGGMGYNSAMAIVVGIIAVLVIAVITTLVTVLRNIFSLKQRLLKGEKSFVRHFKNVGRAFMQGLSPGRS